MDVACVTLGFSILSQCKEAGAEYGTNALKGAVDAAAELGAPIVNCYLAGIAPELFVAAARPAAEYAGTVGVTIVLENEAHDDSGPAANVRSIVEAIGLAHFGTQYDPCNYYHANEEPYPGAYEIVKPFVRYVHLKAGATTTLRPDPATRRVARCVVVRTATSATPPSRMVSSTPMGCCVVWPRTGIRASSR